MTAGEELGRGSSAARSPRDAGRLNRWSHIGGALGSDPYGSPAHVGVPDLDVIARRRAATRPDVQPADEAAPGECLCGDPAEFVVTTNWFSGRRSRDPVCGRHVDEVVAAITREQARRDGG